LKRAAEFDPPQAYSFKIRFDAAEGEAGRQQQGCQQGGHAAAILERLVAAQLRAEVTNVSQRFAPYIFVA
jgi:hypothetical protein